EITERIPLEAHCILFGRRRGSGLFLHAPQEPLYRGQDWSDPEFVERSLDNFLGWLTAESLSEIHPIERAALILTRIADIWPFGFGNLTIGILAANSCLRQARFAPFFFAPEHAKEFNKAVAQAMSIETQPLVNAIYNSV